MNIIKGDKAGLHTEYFCFDCGQLRLSLTEDKSKCKNCGSTNIITGEVGELDKQKLKKEYNEASQIKRDARKSQRIRAAAVQGYRQCILE